MWFFVSVGDSERCGHRLAKVVKYQRFSIQLLFQLISEAELNSASVVQLPDQRRLIGGDGRCVSV